MRGKPMVLIQDQNGCIVSTSHRLNHDGYLRIRDHRYNGKALDYGSQTCMGRS